MKLMVVLASPYLQIDTTRKPVDAPSVLYHGTFAPAFDRFDNDFVGKNDYGWLGHGFYFTSAAGHAKAYLTKYRGKPANRGKIPRILSVSVDAVKLYPFTDEEYQKSVRVSTARGTSKDGLVGKHAIELTRSLKNAGFEGACYRHKTSGNPIEVVIFDAGNIHITDQNVTESA